MTRSDGERVRLRHAIDRMRATLAGLETGLGIGANVGQEAVEAVVGTAILIATTVAKLDAYVQTERDLG